MTRTGIALSVLLHGTAVAAAIGIGEVGRVAPELVIVEVELVTPTAPSDRTPEPSAQQAATNPTTAEPAPPPSPVDNGTATRDTESRTSQRSAATVAGGAAENPAPRPRSKPQAVAVAPHSMPRTTEDESLAAEPSAPSATEGRTAAESNVAAAAPAAPVAHGPYALSGNPKPDYPAAARRRGIEGTVLLRAAVPAEGGYAEVSVLQSSGHGLLDRAALEAVRRWRFAPAEAAGRRVAGSIDLPVTFRLTD